MSLNISKFFEELFNNFLDINNETDALIVSDRDGLVITGEKREDVDIEIVSVLTTIINPILERIRHEFSFQNFGTASFDTEKHRLLFISVNETTTLSIVLDPLASVDKVSPYAYFLAEKAAQIINMEEGDQIQLKVPNFEYEAERSERLKEQIYQLRLDQGGEYRFKFIIIGDHEVGKTSIVRRFVENKFTKDYRATIGLNIMSHKYEFYGNQIQFSLWDIGAQSFFKRFRKTYYTGAQAAFIVFDVTNRESFENIQTWYDEVNQFLDLKKLPIVIVGNKVDLENQRIIEYQEGVKMTKEISEKEDISNISYIETSALTGENIQDAFSLISYHYIMKHKELEEGVLRKDLKKILDENLEKTDSFEINFLQKNLFWSPGLQILMEVYKDSPISEKIEESDKRIYRYSNGLVLKNSTFENFKIENSDCVFCIFDGRSKEHIDLEWRETIIKIIEELKDRKVLLVGIRVSEGTDWSQLLEEFNVNQYLENNLISLLFFKIGLEYRLEIYDQLEVMLNTAKDFNN
ncbi:MAG: GTP-binding protein [Promethearchaeota archaeon]|nr:MAG: GTP-binding protein [Candidatus Lokiarchaeota archaeon]